MGGTATEQDRRISWLVVALRPIVIIGGGLIATAVLTRLVPDLGPGFDTGWEPVFDALPITVEVAIIGLLAALVVGGALGALARLSEPLDRLVGMLVVPFSALSAPVVGLTIVYWLVIQLGWLRVSRWVPFADDAVEHIKGLVIPTLTIVVLLALPIASTVRDTVRPWRPRPLGHDAAAGLVANRSGPLVRRLFGAPLGALLAALISIEVVLAIPGLFWLVTTATFQADVGMVTRVVAIIVVVGALLSLVVDLVSVALDASLGDGTTDPVGPPPSGGGSAAPGGGPGRPLALAGVGIGGLLLGAIALMAIIGRIAGAPDSLAFGGSLGLLADGHLLGTDRIGRDLLHLLAYGAWGTVVSAVVPAIVATGVGLGAALIARSAGSGGGTILGLAVDVLWWPMVPLLMLVPLIADRPGPMSPLFLLIVTLGLIPVAYRLAQRELAAGASLPLGALGILALLAGVAASVLVVVGLLLGFAPEPTWGALLGGGRLELAVTPRLSVVPGLAITFLLLGFNLAGASLLRLARPSA